MVALLALLGVLVVAALLLWWAASGTTDSRSVSPGEVHVFAGATRAESGVGDELIVVGYNIAYGRGPGGDEAGPWTRDHIERTLDALAAQIEATGAHVAALQEVDLGAHRSHGIDQARYLTEKLGWSNYACALTWENNYVPFPYWPPARHYGRMKSGQCVLSRLPIRSSVRYRLPQPAANPFWYNWFYLHRALQAVTIEAGGGRVVELVNVHLEAFDVPNREAQVGILEDVLRGLETDRVVLVGDFNALPPGATRRHGFADEPDADFREDKSMARIYAMDGLREALGPAGPDDPATFTFPADAPSRRLDYLFVRPGFVVTEGRVLHDGPALSDHRGIVARLRFAR
ncbi:MAG: endonuclease [Myxococcales bacterium]